MVDHSGSARVRLAPVLRLEWQRGRDTHFLIAPEGMVQLNRNAAVILGLCDGSRDAEAIAREVARRGGAETDRGEVREFRDVARRHGWVVDV